MNVYHDPTQLAMHFALGCIVLCVLGFAAMGISDLIDWWRAKHRKDQASYHATTPKDRLPPA